MLKQEYSLPYGPQQVSIIVAIVKEFKRCSAIPGVDSEKIGVGLFFYIIRPEKSLTSNINRAGEKNVVKKREDEKKYPEDYRFGKFLLDRGVVSEGAVLDALNFQKKEIVLIGKIAVHEKKLTIKQVLQILDSNINSSEKFGETAVRLGLLESNEVEKLLDAQRRLRRPVGQLLVQLDEIDLNTLKKELEEYFKNRKGS